MNCPLLFAEIVSRGSFPLWLTILLGLLALAAGFGFYFTESMKLTTGRRIGLAVARSLILLAIVWLLRKPVWVSDVTTEKQRPIVLLADNSQSMTLKDPRLTLGDQMRVAIARDTVAPNAGLAAPTTTDLIPTDKPSRLEVLKKTLENPRLDLVNKLRPVGPVQPYLFGSKTRGFADSPKNDWLANLTAEDPKSQITDTITDLFQRDEKDLPAAIVLMTDGRDNGSVAQWDDVIAEARRLGVPVHVYGIGGSAQGFLQLKDATIQDTVFIEDTVTVPVRYWVQGIKAGEAELTLTLGGKVVATKRVPIRDGQEANETLSFTPTKEDAGTPKQEMAVTVKVTQGSESLEDRFAKMVRVADRKVKMLYVESNPRWEFKFMQRAFMRDRRVEPTFIVINGDRKALESGAPYLPGFPDTRKDLFAFDLLVIGDVDANYFTGEQRNWIKDFVTEGGGLVVLAGRLHAPASWLNTPLAEVLPVEVPSLNFPVDDNKRPVEYKPLLNDFGRRSPILSLADDTAESARIWNELPGLYWHYPVTKLRPAAISLLDHPREKIVDDKPMPLIAMQYYGKGLVYFSAVDETWRWRFNEADKYFSRYWGQVVYAIGLPHTLGAKSAQLALAGGEALLGKPGTVFARLFTSEFRPLTKERVTATVERLDGGPNDEKYRTVTFEAVPNQPGEYTATLPNDRVGRYALRVESGSEQATLDYRVSLPPEHELAPGVMSENSLRTFAEQTGGKFYREEDLYKLPAEIQARTVSLTQRREVLLWTSWYVWGAIVGLFTLEWVVRKFWNMS